MPLIFQILSISAYYNIQVVCYIISITCIKLLAGGGVVVGGGGAIHLSLKFMPKGPKREH